MFAEIGVDTRGCGDREDGGLYACCGLAAPGQGAPVEAFVLDPPIPWTEGPFRGVQFRKHDDGAVDIIMWVGAENYPTVPDFIEEGRRMGFCKRIPTGELKKDGSIAKGNNDYSGVTPFLSRMILIHPRAVVQQTYRLELCDAHDGDTVPHITRHDGYEAPDRGLHHIHRGANDDPCTFALWDLSALQAHPGHKIISSTEARAHIQTPSCEYHVQTPIEAAGTEYDPQGPPLGVVYAPGAFLNLPLGHFEFVNSDGSGEMPAAIAELLGDNIAFTSVKER